MPSAGVVGDTLCRMTYTSIEPPGDCVAKKTPQWAGHRFDAALEKGAKPFDLKRFDPAAKPFGSGDKLRDKEATAALATELDALQNLFYADRRFKLLVVLQGTDTSGKDGTLRGVFSRMSPLGVHTVAWKAPNEDERARDYLWRIHQAVPGAGELMIFNRSHYEDIVAVRVKKLFPDEVWKRRQRHVAEFERMLAEEGTTIVKIFLHISKDEQKRRLQSRIDNPAKHWKIHPDDLTDRARWSDFMTAYEEVIGKTSTDQAPWYVVPADRKWYRNLCVARIMLDTLKKLEMEFPPIDWDPKALKIED